MQGANDIPEPDYPYPVRYWWLKRICMLAMSLLVLLTLTRLIWGWDASRRLRAEIEAAHARGEPILAQDFVQAPLPDSENYVAYLNQGIAAYNPALDSPSNSTMEFMNYPPFPPEWHNAAKQAVVGQQATLQLMRRARAHSKVNWDLTPGINVIKFPQFNQIRAITNLLHDTAQYEHERGDDAASIDAVRDLLAVSDAMKQMPVLVGYLVAIAMESSATTRLQVLAPHLRIAADSASTTPGVSPRPRLSRASVQLLIAQLQSQNHSRLLVNAIRSENAYSLELADLLTKRTVLLDPMFQLDVLHSTRIREKVIAGISARELMPTFETFGSVSYSNGMFPDAMYARSLSRSLYTYSRIIQTDNAERFDLRVAALSLAIQLYRLDHGGNWPQRLDELVPDYLSAVPVDPLPPNPTLMNYSLGDGSKRPMIYSTGWDGIDQRASGAVAPTVPQYGWHRISGKIDDQFRDLSYFASVVIPAQSLTNPATLPIDQE